MCSVKFGASLITSPGAARREPGEDGEALAGLAVGGGRGQATPSCSHLRAGDPPERAREWRARASVCVCVRERARVRERERATEREDGGRERARERERREIEKEKETERVPARYRYWDGGLSLLASARW